MNLNLAIIVGRLTRDPELKALPSGQQLCSMSIATNQNYKDRDGNKQEKVEFHNIVVFGNSAESCGRFLRKGQLISVEGRIQTRTWDDTTSGEKRYRTEIIASNVQFGPKANDTASKEAEPTRSEEAAPKASQAPKKAAAAPKVDKGFEYPTEDINPEDIPF